MKTSEFLAQLARLQIRISVDGGDLKITAPKGALTPDIRSELGRRKDEILRLLAKSQVPARASLPPIERAPRGGRLPLSFTQERIWFMDQLEPGISAYNMWLSCRLRGPLDVPALDRSLAEIVRRHEVLRTTFQVEDGVPAQIVADSIDTRIELLEELPDRGLPLTDEDIWTWLPDRVDERYDLEQGPLFRRPVLVRVDPEQHVFFVAMHHTVFDGVSNGLFFRELTTLYEAFSEGGPSPLPELPVQYADYSLWQRNLHESHGFDDQLDFWKGVLGGGLPVLDLPTDRPRPAVQTHNGATVWYEMSHDAIDALEKLGNQKGATLFMVLVAAYKAFLQRYTGQEDVLVGTAVANRSRAEIENLIGFFVNTLVLRTDLSGDPSFRELMVRVRDVCLGALENQDMPFQLLVDELQPERSLSHTPLFQTLFVLDEDPGDSRDLGGLTIEGFELPRHYARTDIVMTGYRGRDGFYFWCEYNTDLFEKETVQRMLGHYVRTLERVAAEPDRPLSEIPLLADDERTQVLVEWNDTAADYSDAPVHAQVEAQADRTPDATALVFPSLGSGPGDGGGGDEHLTYRELDQRANRLAHHLRSRGVQPGALVGLCLERSLEMVVAQHAILKVGAAYVPLDPSFPLERLAYMASDAGLAQVVTTTALAGLLPSDLRLTCLDSEAAEIEAASPDRPGLTVRPEERMYVIYTSGSTGRPKGVEIEHRSVSNFLASMAREPGFAEGQSLLAVTTLSFDISVLELTLPLVRGGTVIVAPKAATGDGAALASLLERLRPDAMQATPATWRMLLLAGWKGDPSLRLFCGGEALPRELADELLPLGGELWNLYGPTEATIWSTVARVEPVEGAGSAVSIGRPIANTQVYVLDAARRPTPVGVPGELWIAGDGLARGYLERPELTAERFVPDPFSDRPGARMYVTGDLARWHADGTLECLGRVDNQVKVHGFRIELGEIEAVLDDAPGVEQCVTVVREDRPGDRRLVAYVTTEEGAELDPDALRAHAGEQLPTYMVPAAFVPVEAFPLTPNRKVDRRALLELEPAAPTARREYAAPEGPLQTGIAAIYAEVLGVDRVGQHDDFFELGGNSLLTTQAMARIRAEFEVDLPLRDMFEAASVRGLAERVLAAAPATLTRIEPVPRDGSPLPLSFTQQRLWFLDQLEPGNAVYNVWMAWTLRGALDAPAFGRALAEIVRRHEVLRTHFAEVDGIPSQVVAPLESIVLRREEPPEGAGPERGERAAQVERLVTEHAREPFDLAHGPLLRPLLVRVGDGEHVFCLSAHHTILDAWSMGRFRHELELLYEAYRAGAESPLPELELQYADYAAWQRDFFQGEAFDEQVGWWREQLAGAPVLTLPTDRPRPAEQNYVGANATRQLSAGLMKRVEELGAAQNATPFMVLLAGLNVLLHRYGGQADISVGSVVAGRARRELEELMGYFANTLVLRTDLEGDPSFRELLARVREVCLDAYDRQDTPFEQLVAELQPVRDLSYTPLFQVLFVLDDSLEAADHIGSLEVEAFDVEGGVAHTDLTLWARRHSDGLTATFEYATDLWDQATVERMLAHLERLLEGAAATPDAPVSRLGLLGDEERATLLGARNRTEAEFPLEPVHAQFEAQVDRTPEAPAVVYVRPTEGGGVGGVELSYRELDVRANRLARYLSLQGVEPDTLVGLCLERSLDMVVAQLAIQKAGAAYVPLDPAFPPDRLAYMIEDARLASVVTRRELRELLEGTGARAIALDQASEEIAAQSAERLALDVGADARMYVIYTSGSTGRPKGVELEHRSVSNFLASMAREPGLDPSETLLAVTTLSFDISVLELMLPLMVGARVAIASSETAADGEELRALLERLDPDVMQATPATWRMLILAGWKGSPRVRILCGGEALPRELAEDLLPLGREVWNLYGPTETTVWSTVWKVSSGDGPVLIGRPIDNTEIYVLDAAGQPTPEGIPGELWIGGDGLARGYLERPELTTERFRHNPFDRARPGARMYRTGDLARWNRDGLLECMGRIDNQVKLRGFRIELGEIESVLAEDPEVLQCVAAVREDTPGDQRLVAYLVMEGGREPDVASLRERARGALPAYMVPSAYAGLERLPLTPNGKVDRRALLAMGRVQAGSGVEFVAPSTPLEVALAEIWAELLGSSEVSVYDNFFDLGGHSLLSVQVMARVRDRLGVSISPRDLMLQNLGQLAAVCEERLAGEASRASERHGPGTRLIEALTSVFRRRSAQAPPGPGAPTDESPGPRGRPE